MFVRAGQNGYLLYCGGNSTGKENSSAENVVLRLVEEIPRNQNYKLCFGNWLSTPELCLKLKALRILTIATVRSNRIAKCPSLSEKDLKKVGRGASSLRVDSNSWLIIILLFYNKFVNLALIYCSPTFSEKIRK